MPRKKSAQKCSGNTKSEHSENSKRNRAWAITAFNGEPEFLPIHMKYLIYGEETCPDTGKTHWQTYVYFFNAKTFTAVQKIFSGNHIEQAIRSPEENMAYCAKDLKFKEFGERPSQGKRSDLQDLAKRVINGDSVDSIAIDDPMAFHQYGRTLERIETIALRTKYRTEYTEGIWYWGETGVGKSHKAFEGFDPKTHYLYRKDNGWWDGYKGQETVIINEFRGAIAYEDMLELVDKWPYYVNSRGREGIPFISKRVIVTSSLPPEEVYKKRNKQDSLHQLLRRFKVIKLN